MKRFILALAVVAYALNLNAQKCTEFEPGQVIKSSVKTWYCMKPLTPEWAKMKPAAKAKFVEEYNANAESGTEKPAYEGNLETKIKEVLFLQDQPELGELVVSSTEIAGVEYNSNTLCKGDTLFIVRGDDRLTYTKGPNGEITGHSITGVQIIPKNLKVGDVLPMYEDYSTTLPTSSEWTESVQQITGYKDVKSTYQKQDMKNNLWEITETKSEAIWDDVAVRVKMESQFVMQIKNWVNANVVREEELEIDGKKYKAFVIESQKWVKSGTQSVITSDNKKWQSTYERVNKRIQNKANKEIAKMGIMNEEGYMITFLTEWYIPSLGVVKYESYDMNGFLTSRFSWENLK
jgi:hypothetical protein